MDHAIHIIHKVPSDKGVINGVAFHAVVFGKIVVVSDVFQDRGLAEHMPFNPPSNGEVAHTDTRIHVVETMHQRVTVGDIDLGTRIREKISDLTLLLKAYRSGLIRQNTPTGY